MHIPRLLIFVGTVIVAFAARPCIVAQAATATSPSSSSQTTTDSSTGSTAADLFPPGGVQSTAQPPHGGAGGGHHNGGGNHRRNGRRNDLLVSQADADPLEVRVAYRRAKTIALARDPGLATLIRQAAAAGTDIDKRAYLKLYYTRLFASVRRIDPSPAMKTHVDVLAAVTRQRYDPKRREVGGEEELVSGRGRGRKGRVQ